MSPDKKMMLEKMLMGEGSPMTKPMHSEAGGEGNMKLVAKLEALQEMINSIYAEVGGKVKTDMEEHKKSLLPPMPAEEMKSVTVAAPDEESLEDGLEMAKEVVPEMEEKMSEPEVVEKEDEEEDEDEGQYGLFGKRK